MRRRVYAIRHRPSGGYLPAPHGQLRNRPATEREPTRDAVPRLFSTRGDARRSLAYWLRGKGIRLGDRIDYAAIPSRMRHDMEIVELTLRPTDEKEPDQ